MTHTANLRYTMRCDECGATEDQVAHPDDDLYHACPDKACEGRLQIESSKAEPYDMEDPRL